MDIKLWGGRFRKEIDPGFFNFQKSLDYDKRLARYDIFHSKIHIYALCEAGLLSVSERKKIDSALDGALADLKKGKLSFNRDAEDVHTAMQFEVNKRIGSLSEKLHTLRSRNDQVVFDEKCYCLEEVFELINLLELVEESLVYLKNKYKDLIIPGYTHTRRAQVVLFSEYISSFSLMFKEDRRRLVNFHKSITVYIGSGALAGNPLGNSSYKKAISFLPYKFKSKIKPVSNSLDNVSNRDFIIELLSCAAMLQMHLSRLAEDFIMYSTKEFSFLDIPEDFCTGSSLMPHKKNPDFLELTRGSTGRVYGNLVSVLTVMKGLPLTYNRDMQLDKEPLFDSVETLKKELKIMSALIKKVKLNKEPLAAALEDESLFATEIAEYLVRQKVSFYHAHRIVGSLIRHCEEKGTKILDMPQSELIKFHNKLIASELGNIMDPGHAVKSKNKT
ncbi:MAG: argininosuccinate lyase [Candidatus Omnitrophota bacterium]